MQAPATQLSGPSHSSVRLARAMRFTRCLRLVRLPKLYRATSEVLRRHRAISQETRVGKTLTEATMKKMMEIVLILVMFLPLMEIETFIIPKTSFEYDLKNTWTSQETAKHAFHVNTYIEYHSDCPTPLIYLSISQGQVRENWLGPPRLLTSLREVLRPLRKQHSDL